MFLSFTVVFVYCSILPLAHADKSSSSKSHKKQGSLSKVDTTPNLEDSDVFSLTSEANLYQNSLYENFDIDYSSQGGWDIQVSSYGVPVYQDPNLNQSFQADTLY